MGDKFAFIEKGAIQMREKFTLHGLGHILGLYLDKLERAFQLDSKDVIKVNQERARDCIKRGRYDAATSLCQKTLELDPENVEAQYQLGVAYMGNQLMEEAMRSFRKVLKLAPNRAGAHYRLGVLYDRTGALDSATTSYKKAIKLEPEQADYYYTLGVAQDKKGEHKQSIESLNKAIQLAPDVDKYHYRLGLVYDGQGQHDKAVGAFKKAVEAEEAGA